MPAACALQLPRSLVRVPAGALAKLRSRAISSLGGWEAEAQYGAGGAQGCRGGRAGARLLPNAHILRTPLGRSFWPGTDVLAVEVVTVQQDPCAAPVAGWGHCPSAPYRLTDR